MNPRQPGPQPSALPPELHPPYKKVYLPNNPDLFKGIINVFKPDHHHYCFQYDAYVVDQEQIKYY